MPLAHPTHVVSFSSEDPHHPASNLLNRETYRKWKCKEPGEKEAFVILKFEKAVTINGVDIGNDGSALVEVSVARSGSGGEPQFEVLLSSTAFISPLDSREGKNLNGVKSFSINSLSKPIAAQKWDLVKVQVSQPFNRHVQYGLTFVKFMVAPDPNEPQKIGMFGLRKPIGGDDSDEDEDLRPGSLFNRKFSPKSDAASPRIQKPSTATGNLSTNAEIRKASTNLVNASKSGTEDDVKGLLRKPKLDLPTPSSSSSKKPSSSKDNSPLPKKKQLPDPPMRSTEKDKNGTVKQTSSPASSPKVATSTLLLKKRALSPDPPARANSSSNSSPSTSRSLGTPAKKQKKARKTKPLNKLMEGVVFSMSGFENPLRGQLREKAIEMGARYKADWDRTCTHLICAFYNTPKFRQVKADGNGKIVKKEWIQKSYADKCRYPWRRYCLDRSDGNPSESEEEIYADDENGDFLDDTDTIAAENGNKETNQESIDKVKRKRVLVIESSDDEGKSDDSKKAYEVDTDVDEDRTPDLSPSILDEQNNAPPLFQNKCFYLHSEVSRSNQNIDIENIIKKHKGQIHKILNDRTDYYVCNSFDWNDSLTDAVSDNPNLVLVHSNWIVDCHIKNDLVDKDSFLVSPN